MPGGQGPVRGAGGGAPGTAGGVHVHVPSGFFMTPGIAVGVPVAEGAGAGAGCGAGAGAGCGAGAGWAGAGCGAGTGCC